MPKKRTPVQSVRSLIEDFRETRTRDRKELPKESFEPTFLHSWHPLSEYFIEKLIISPKKKEKLRGLEDLRYQNIHYYENTKRRGQPSPMEKEAMLRDGAIINAAIHRLLGTRNCYKYMRSFYRALSAFDRHVKE